MILAEMFAKIRRNQVKAPVNVLQIANALGLKVYRSRPGKWPRGLSGLIRRAPKKDDKFAIYVNGDHDERRRRFTIAHEIAHFVLHRHLIGDGIYDDALYLSGLSSDVEAQANELAADILMPWNLIDKVLDSVETINIESLADRFQVSNDAMAIRLLGVPYRKPDED